jgi:hypothetical protein
MNAVQEPSESRVLNAALLIAGLTAAAWYFSAREKAKNLGMSQAELSRTAVESESPVQKSLQHIVGNHLGLSGALVIAPSGSACVDISQMVDDTREVSSKPVVLVTFFPEASMNLPSGTDVTVINVKSPAFMDDWLRKQSDRVIDLDRTGKVVQVLQ